MKAKVFILIGIVAGTLLFGCNITTNRYRKHKPLRKSKIPSWTMLELNTDVRQIL